MIATAIEVNKLIDVVLIGLLSGLGVSTLFALAALGIIRANERRLQSRLLASAYGSLALVGLIASFAAVTYGIILLTEK